MLHVHCVSLQAEGGVDAILEMRADVNLEQDLELTKIHGRIVVSFTECYYVVNK